MATGYTTLTSSRRLKYMTKSASAFRFLLATPFALLRHFIFGISWSWKTGYESKIQ